MTILAKGFLDENEMLAIEKNHKFLW